MDCILEPKPVNQKNLNQIQNYLISSDDIITNKQMTFGQKIVQVTQTPAGFSCGMCAKKYRSIEQAYTCMVQNLLELKDIPVVDNQYKESRYSCLMCGKSYKNKLDAIKCTESEIKRSSISEKLKQAIYQFLNTALNKKIESKRDVLNSRQQQKN